ncbi:inhibitor of sigma-G Gin [Tumebacillus flagellatus]|uniref:Inhibitor of sigma-G Gin n=2 Tax=Tumebacillus flagellatus TaxID=1157490 RepID=A0A074LGU4_9BACL|nr:inhibitor of sigma-G Gin [Tumebacillus flagellatus]
MARMEERNTANSGGTCIVCSQQKDLGIRIFQSFLCTECEREIVQTDVLDEKYPYYIDRMKQIWMSAIS